MHYIVFSTHILKDANTNGMKEIHVTAFQMTLFFLLGLTSHSRIFHSYGDVTITAEGLQSLTYTRHGTHGRWAVRVL